MRLLKVVQGYLIDIGGSGPLIDAHMTQSPDNEYVKVDATVVSRNEMPGFRDSHLGLKKLFRSWRMKNELS